jgi:hypothetical protein
MAWTPGMMPAGCHSSSGNRRVNRSAAARKAAPRHRQTTKGATRPAPGGCLAACPSQSSERLNYSSGNRVFEWQTGLTLFG